MNLGRLFLFLMATIYCCINAYAQSSPSASNTSLQSAMNLFHQSLNDQSGLYNGSIYLRPNISLNQGHAYFKTDSLTNATVKYDGVMYENVPLMYDEVKDVLVTKDFSGFNLVQLINEKVDGFHIGQNEFIKLTSADGHQNFYRLVHRGKMLLLHRETKFIRQRIVRENEYNRYVQTLSTYFIYREGSLTEIDSYRQLMSFFGDKKKQVQEHIRRKGLKYREAIEPTIIEAVEYFETLQAQ